MQFHVDNKFQLRVFLISLLLLFIQLKPIEECVFANYLLLSSKNLYYILFIAVSFILTLTVLHESIHAFFYLVFGANIKLGFIGINPYIIDVSKKHFSAVIYSIIILSPLVLISLLSLFFSSEFGSLIFYFNLFSSSGDILLAFSLCPYPNSEFIDESFGYTVYHK
ncbi:MAG: DUF3267 domain-containing protein [Bacillota bacterium]|nr:DUF3267 domain-containing protein [Bacillota bacterium]